MNWKVAAFFLILVCCTMLSYSQTKKVFQDFKYIFIQFKPYSLELTDEGKATIISLTDSIKRSKKFVNQAMYLRAFYFIAEIKQDSFICAKRLHIINNILYDSCKGYIKNVFSVNNFKNDDDSFYKYSKKDYEYLLNMNCGVFVVLRDYK